MLKNPRAKEAFPVIESLVHEHDDSQAGDTNESDHEGKENGRRSSK